MKSSLSFAKVSFVVSLAGIAFLYGAGVGEWNWFPRHYMDRAVAQARGVMRMWSDEEISTYGQTYDRQGTRVYKPRKVQTGMTVITSAWKSNSDTRKVGIRLIDRKGKVLNEWMVDREEVFGSDYLQHGRGGSKIHGSLLLPGGDVVFNLEYTGMARLDACGEVLWTLGERAHHSIAQGRDGSFWAPGVSQTKLSSSDRYPDGFPGLDGRKVWLDRILHVSSGGEVLQRINVLDILYANGLERYIPKVLGGKRPTPEKIPEDLTHLNDVEPLSPAIADEYPLFEAGDLLVSLRSLSLVFVFDPDTKEVKWHSSEPFIYQHDPDFIGEGKIGVFDNNYDLTSFSAPTRGTMLGGNRIVYIQPHTDSTKIRFPTQQSELFYTHIGGKWQKLDNGNMLLTEFAAGRVLEVSTDGKPVWEWVQKSYDSKVPPVTKATRVDLTREEVASWPCSSVDSVSTSTQKQQTAP